MMAIEKKLALSDLSKYDEIQKRNNLARDIIKYQNFRTEVAIEKMASNNFSKITLRNYISAGRSYIKTGVRTKCGGDNFYEALDSMLAQHVQPLTPNKDEQIRIYNKKEKSPTVSIPDIDTSKPMIEKFEYGIRLNGMIRLFNDESEAKLFIDGAKFAGKDLELLSVVANPL